MYICSIGVLDFSRSSLCEKNQLKRISPSTYRKDEGR